MGDRGSVAVELAIVAPALLGLLMLAIYGARVVWAERQVQAAASAAARAASQQGNLADAETVANQVVTENLLDAGLSCSELEPVELPDTIFEPGGQVSVRVTCTADVSSVAFVGSGSLTFSDTATEVIDTLRGGSGL